MYKLRSLRITDAISLLEMQQRNTNPEYFTHRDIYSIIYALTFDRFVGMFDDGKLIAYSIFSKANVFDLNIIGKEKVKVGRFSGTVVDRDYRGKGLQRDLLNSHLEYAREQGYSSVMAYAHSDNAASVKNIEKAGLSLIKNMFIESKQDYRNLYSLELY